LIAEDDQDDRLLLEVALRPFESSMEVKFVKDGEELMEYLLGRGAHAELPRLGLILLDLNMPKVDGRQALVEIRRRGELKDIPIVIWTTSNEEEDKAFCAKMGASDYITKPNEYVEMESVVKKVVESRLRLCPDD
jgi:CheY-like chemotaxis protein